MTHRACDLVALILIAAVLLAPAQGRAQQTNAQRVALAPVASLSGSSSRALKAVERTIEAGLAGVPGFTLIRADELKKAAKHARRPELRSCEGDSKCLSELGSLVSASHTVYAEVGGLGNAQVVYLKLVDVQSGEETRSTTLELAGDQGKDTTLAAATRLLAPGRYVGLLALSTSIPGAAVFLDGHHIATTPSAPIEIYVGSHALRVTHPERSDYVRWVDIAFQEKTTIEAELRPLADLRQKLSLRGTLANPDDDALISYRPTPWYYRWYTIGGGAAVILVGSAILFSNFGDDIDADLTRRL